MLWLAALCTGLLAPDRITCEENESVEKEVDSIFALMGIYGTYTLAWLDKSRLATRSYQAWCAHGIRFKVSLSSTIPEAANRHIRITAV